ncbi:hypothetical protein F5Y12DRAFT_778797 [Xylaria sp. FL1777]|nr:hypothetical protein F5Y12DRAFT_778797 [Xylaria sp. FL1777]
MMLEIYKSALMLLYVLDAFVVLFTRVIGFSRLSVDHSGIRETRNHIEELALVVLLSSRSSKRSRLRNPIMSREQ